MSAHGLYKSNGQWGCMIGGGGILRTCAIVKPGVNVEEAMQIDMLSLLYTSL